MDIIIKNISKKYNDKVVLDSFNNVFKEKYISFIMGTSGVGKTTLIRILMNLDKVDSGEIIGINDKKISAVFQENSLCENLSVLSNLKLVCKNINYLEVEKALDALDLNDCINKRVRELSGGMKRRVAILRALLYDFDLLIMDEPLNGLDVTTKFKVMDFVISKLENKSAIIITHAMDDIEYFKKHKDLSVDIKII